ncbi:deoxyribose-phosphate aldolase [Myxococcus sp. K15C18031901]|uniref:deoxyribose-phosphate aldolase n=1 Tax=Myxococcus dinghuensis TaxID=2906761 RepID=UPI0020A7E40E|nr:deoxyribose-phosphate aldolase [Myxococcus dinghuensis]MCP3103239.1 deoxyribose-phosphate aldolase [Myxococcus dinghuensis]
MSDSRDLSEFVEEITARVRRHMSEWKAASEASAAQADVAPGSAPWPSTGRVAPESLRSAADVAPYIDHTLLKPEARTEDVVKLSEEARQYGFATVCVNSSHVAAAAKVLAGSRTVPIAVVGFPLGVGLPSSKAFEAREAIRAGAREIDMVVHVGALKARELARVHQDIVAVVEASRPWPVKVILETSLLTDEEKVIACVLSKAAGAAFVKTSTGFGSGGATVEDVALMRLTVGEDVGVKASGGIRSADDAMKMLRAGANRLGASASVAIVNGQVSSAKY